MDVIRCFVCGKEHPLEESEVAFQYPDAYLELPADERDARAKLNEDFCSIDEKCYFVRCVIPIAFVDGSGMYCWGVWAEVDRETFQSTLATWNDENQELLPRLEARIANDIPYYGETRGLAVELERRTDTRPFLHIIAGGQLYGEQRSGVPISKIFDYVHSI